MDFKFSVRRLGAVSIVDVVGRITAGEALVSLRDTIRDEVANGHNRILINLKEVSYVDSSGLGELVLALGTVTQTICARCGATLFKDDDGQWEPCAQCEGVERKPWGQLKLAAAGRQVTDLLNFTRLNTVFELHESEADALAAFAR